MVLVSLGQGGCQEKNPAARRRAAANPGAARVADQAVCGALTARYLAERAVLNRCDDDADCAEVWPGPCGLGPYYIHSQAHIQPLWHLADRLRRVCGLSGCAKPPRLPAGGCWQNRCIRGRRRVHSAPGCGAIEFRVTYLEVGRPTVSRTRARPGPGGDRLALGVERSGTMWLEITWPPACPGCRLIISPRRADLTAHTRFPSQRQGRRELIQRPVERGVYYFRGRSAQGARPFTLRADLRARSGRPLFATHHGVVTLRQFTCSGAAPFP